MTITSDVIKSIRKELGLTQGKLAKALGLTRELINKMELGKLPISRASKIIITKFMEEKNLISEKYSHNDYSANVDDENQELEDGERALIKIKDYRSKYITLLEKTLREKEQQLKELQAKDKGNSEEGNNSKNVSG